MQVVCLPLFLQTDDSNWTVHADGPKQKESGRLWVGNQTRGIRQLDRLSIPTPLRRRSLSLLFFILPSHPPIHRQAIKHGATASHHPLLPDCRRRDFPTHHAADHRQYPLLLPGSHARRKAAAAAGSSMCLGGPERCNHMPLRTPGLSRPFILVVDPAAPTAVELSTARVNGLVWFGVKIIS